MGAIRRFVGLGIILCATCVCAGEDWNQFRGPGRDGVSTESGLLRKWPEGGPAMLWSFEGLGGGFASVSVVEGTIYTTGMIEGKGYLSAIDTNGKLKWKKEYGPEDRLASGDPHHPDHRRRPSLHHERPGQDRLLQQGQR